MQIIECEVPSASLLDRETIEKAYFRDSYRVPLAGSDATVVDVFFAIFGHRPVWMSWALRARNRIALACGLNAATASQLMAARRNDAYLVGDDIGSWPIFAHTPTELIAGRDDKHLDFRLSVLIERNMERNMERNTVREGAYSSVTLSTVCTVHNWAGKVYLFFVAPLHQAGIKLLIRRAVAAKRL